MRAVEAAKNSDIGVLTTLWMSCEERKECRDLGPLRVTASLLTTHWFGQCVAPCVTDEE